MCKIVHVLSSTLLPRIHRHRLYHYYGFICHLHILYRSLPHSSFPLSPALRGTDIKTSSVNQTIQYWNPTVITFSRIRIPGVGTFCNLTPATCQYRFALAKFPLLTKPSFRPCRYQQRPWLRIAFPPVRWHSLLSSCRICLHAEQTKNLRENKLPEVLTITIYYMFASTANMTSYSW